jgi:hypothetical protein
MMSEKEVRLRLNIDRLVQSILSSEPIEHVKYL